MNKNERFQLNIDYMFIMQRNLNKCQFIIYKIDFLLVKTNALKY